MPPRNPERMPPPAPPISFRLPSAERILGAVSGFFISVRNTLRANPGHWLLFSAGVAASLYLYISLGSDSDVSNERRSIFDWFALTWGRDEYKHSPFMLAFAGFVVWLKRKELAETEASYDFAGSACLAGILMMHITGYTAQLPRLSLGASVLTLWCLVWAVWGRKIAKILWFPTAYIFLCFWGSLLTEMTMKLRLMSSQLSCALLNFCQIGAVNYGTVVISRASDGTDIQFDVAEVCSGLRTLIVMTALSAPYAYLVLKCGVARKLILFALSVPLAILANALRIFTLGVVSYLLGVQTGMKLYHDLSGFIVMIIAIALLKLTGTMLEKDWKKYLCEKLSKIKKLPPPSRG